MTEIKNQNTFFLTEVDRKIMKASEEGLSFSLNPFGDLAKKCELPQEVVISRMKEMQAAGVIRRVAAVPNHYKLGYKFNGMTVWDVTDERISELGMKVGALDFVSHCYRRPRLRDWNYNLFAMVHGITQAQVDLQIQQIREILGTDLKDYKVLLSKRILKKTGFRSKGDN